MPDMTTALPDGKTATSKDKKSRMVVRGGLWVNDDSYVPPAGPSGKAETTTQDRTALNEASAAAQAERDAMRTYGAVGKSVRDMGPTGTGPVANWYFDAITPEEDGGILDTVGAVLGTPLRALHSNRTFAARDHLKTVGANVALAGSQQMKGSSSDKDTALMRLSGIGPAKTVGENERIIRDATYKSGLAQARAQTKSGWIAKYGSLSAPAPNGLTFEEALQIAETRYGEYTSGKRKLPKAPPKRGGGGPITIDINGNPIP